MKTRASILWVISILILIVSACEKYEREDLNPDPIVPPTNGLMFKSTGSATTTSGDTIISEVGTIINLHGIPPAGVTISTWLWYFTEPNTGAVTQSMGQDTCHRFMNVGYGQIQLIATPAGGGNPLSSTRVVKVVSDIGQMDPVTVWNATQVSSNNWELKFAINKRVAKYPGTWGFIGTMTNPQWVVNNLASSDTNYLLVGGNLTTPGIGIIGTQAKIHPVQNATTYPTHDQMGVVKTDLSGNAIWADLFPSKWVEPANPTLIKYSLQYNGAVTPDGTSLVNVPGDIGDNVIRFTLGDNAFTIYFNNGAPWGAAPPFYVRGHENGTWPYSPVAQAPVTSYPNWGQATLSYTDLPTTGLLILKFGSNIYLPNNFNSGLSTSSYYDGLSHALRIIIRKVQAVNKSGDIRTVDQVAPARMLEQR